MSTDTPVVIHAALNGSAPATRENAAIPIVDDDVIADAIAAWDAGAAVIRLHAREPDGTPSQRAKRFAPLIEGIRAAGCDAILELSCGPWDGAASVADRYDCLRLRPELATFDCATTASARLTPDGPSDVLREVAAAFRAAGTAPEIQCRNSLHVRAALQLRDEGLLDDPLRFELAVATDRCGSATIEHVIHMTSLIPEDAVWSVCAVGASQLRVNVLCLIAGGHIRTGLEDNLWLVDGVPATNQALVERVVRIVDELDRPLATPDEAREILRLHGSPARPGDGGQGRAPSAGQLPAAAGV